MISKFLTVVLTGTVFVLMGVTGCAKKPAAPAVQEEAPKAEVKKEAAPVVEEKADTYEGFRAVEESAEDAARRVRDERILAAKELIANTRLLDVNFDYDKYDIRWNEKGKLQDLAEVLKDHPELEVTIEGHCDDRGTNAYNRGLGEKRANAVQEFLYSLGIMQDRVTQVSYGEEKPLCTEQNEACWSKNRRAHFLLSVGAL